MNPMLTHGELVSEQEGLLQKKMFKGLGIQDLAPIAIIFVVIAFTVSMGATILDDLQEGQTDDGYAYNATGHGLESMQTLGEWLPTLALVVIAAIIIGVLMYYLGGAAKSK